MLWQEPAAVADRLDNALDEAWRRDAYGLVNRAIKAASEGGKGALGWAEVLDSLVQHRVEHLVFAVNATPNHETLAPHVSDALGKPSAEMLVERALEHAVASGADVTTVPDDAGPLLSVGGVVATCDIDSPSKATPSRYLAVDRTVYDCSRLGKAADLT